MKFGKYLESKIKQEWAEYYVDYSGLKDLIKACEQDAQSGQTVAFSPRTTSLTVQRFSTSKDSNEEKFFHKLEGEVRESGLRVDEVVCVFSPASPALPRGCPPAVCSGIHRSLPAL